MVSRAKLIGFARVLIGYWALFGGFILVALVLMTAGSAISNLVANRPFPGDFELVKHGVAIAAFAFLPYAQLTHANVTVDIFTEGMGDGAKAVMQVFASLIAVLLALLLLRQMWLGMDDYIKYPVHMATVPIALWTAFPPAIVSLALLLLAALITAGEAIRGINQEWETPFVYMHGDDAPGGEASAIVPPDARPPAFLPPGIRRAANAAGILLVAYGLAVPVVGMLAGMRIGILYLTNESELFGFNTFIPVAIGVLLLAAGSKARP